MLVACGSIPGLASGGLPTLEALEAARVSAFRKWLRSLVRRKQATTPAVGWQPVVAYLNQVGRAHPLSSITLKSTTPPERADDSARVATFNKGGVLEPGWNRVRNASGDIQALLPDATPWAVVFDRQVARMVSHFRNDNGCHRCDGEPRKFFDGIDWRCWTCNRIITDRTA